MTIAARMKPPRPSPGGEKRDISGGLQGGGRLICSARITAGGRRFSFEINGLAIKILTGNSNKPLAEAIAAKLALPLVRANIRRFSDNEIFVEILENVRGEDVFVIQSTSFPA